MYVWAFDGFGLGSGKTLGMNIFGRYYADKCDSNVFQNYEANSGLIIKDYKFFLQVAQSPTSIIKIDEAHVPFDSRFFAKKSQIYATQLLFYLRKLRSVMFYTSPKMQNVDSRVRDITNIYVRCRYKTGSFLYEVFDYQAGKLLTKFNVNELQAYDYTADYFNTEDMVIPFMFPDDEKEFLSFLNLLQYTNNEFIKEERQRLNLLDIAAAF